MRVTVRCVLFPHRLLLSAAIAAALALATAAPAPAEDVTVAAAGDIAGCSWTRDTDTADLAAAIDPDLVLTLGDNAYPDGSVWAFNNCYDPTWGRFAWKTNPAPGNHEYETDGAAGYFDYFGGRAGMCCRGYYARDVGTWRLYSLNSEESIATQADWLRAKMREDGSECTLAYWHRPRWSDSEHGDYGSVDPLWDAFAANGGDIVLSGHDHNYQRFPKVAGVREFVVGTGGAGNYAVSPDRAVVAWVGNGVLELTLSSHWYSWKFRSTGGAVIDAGAGDC